MNDSPQNSGSKPVMGWFLFLLTVAAVFGLGMLFASVMERREEAKVRRPMAEIGKFETDSAKWAENWPRQHASYREMDDDKTMTKYGGAVPRDYLSETTANVILFAGYGFSKDYLQARGHTYAVEDVTETGRNSGKLPATCWSCKSPDVPRLMAEFGAKKVDNPEDKSIQELALKGAGDFYSHKWNDFTEEITHAIGCLDCHDPDTMKLRVSRPALIEAFERQGKDVNKVSHQEMRTLVCAQCHVEYYFKGDGKYLTFPWDEGMTPEAMESYYNERDFKDWTHAISKTPMIKMQHPDYEVYSTGVHAFRGVSCADCHMPYRTEGGAKFSDHHLQSPLLNIANSCAVCHRWSEEETRNRVTGIQDKNDEGRKRAERAIAYAHFDIAACMQAGATDEQLKPIRHLVRTAQMNWDYVAANNGMGFHSPQECLRVLAKAVEKAQEARVEATRLLATYGYTKPVVYPDFSTKEKAQAINKAFIAGEGPDLLGGFKVSKAALN
ncbi:MAG: ammonia-forming cytochrome c nitrite reductase subunit c552 [Phycisphaeraceae bacterium JB051]